MVPEWLLCDFHIHTTASDGTCSLEEVIDLYGKHGFDAMAITDHILDTGTTELLQQEGSKSWAISESSFPDYLHTLWRLKQTAWTRHRMVLIPGAEVTNNSGQYHILALDIKEYISPDLPVEKIVQEIHRQEGVAVACHPHHKEEVEYQPVYAHLWHHHQEYQDLFDAWEVANRDSLFDVIGLRKFNYIANSDFHEENHVFSWKSMIRSERNCEAIKDAIRRNKDIALYLYRGRR
ncbi:MAG: PHP domain-containing protein [Desulfomonilaceae bacterium]